MNTFYMVILAMVSLLFFATITFVLIGFTCVLWDTIVNEKIFSKMARRSKQ